MRSSYFKYSLVLLWILFSSPIWGKDDLLLSPLPPSVSEKWNNFSLVGQTTLRRYGFHIYDSSFWMVSDNLNNTQAPSLLQQGTYALSITYARKIRAQQLLSSTKKEWQRLGFAGRYPLNAWLKILENIWPNIEKGDQLVAVVTAEGKTIFYNNKLSLGTIEDADFGPAFLSIWLDENSRFRKNRKELLGE